MSRITQDIGSLRQDVRSLNDRIDAMKRSILQHKIDAMKTRSAVEKEMYLGFVSEYNDQVCDLKSQLEEVKNTMKELAEKLD
jgi:predicted RNase H-like nuclease (RuvC/YqgF family)